MQLVAGGVTPSLDLSLVRGCRLVKGSPELVIPGMLSSGMHIWPGKAMEVVGGIQFV